MESFSLDWNEYNDHLKDLMFKMIKTTEYSDVTLMCDDFQFNAHKSILSACSPELCKIIQLTPEKNPVIYLRGVHSKEMEALIEFMYLGRTRIKQDDLQELLNVAQDLKIRGIGDKDLEKNSSEPRPIQSLPDDPDMIIENEVSSENIRMAESFKIESPLKNYVQVENVAGDTLDESVLLDFDTEFEQCFPNGIEDTKNISEIKPAKRGRGRPRKVDNNIISDEDLEQGEENFQGKKAPIKCPECHKKITQPGNLKIHMEAIHQGIRYDCNFCDKSSTTKNNLKKHIANVHSSATIQ